MSHYPPDRHDPLSDPDFSAVVSALRSPGFDQELAGEQRFVSMITAHASAPAVPDHARRNRMSTKLRIKLVTAGLAAAMFATSGLAYAGQLPGAAQSTASQMLAKVGITVPGPNSHAATHPDTRGQSTADTSNTNTGDQPTGANHGQTVSQLAKTTTARGRAKGTTIAATASNGRSTNGQTTATNAKTSGHNTNGQSTAATASNGHSTSGQGHAYSGSGNATTHP
ncbi:MAG TPA: hypothetical protein VI139_10130 [Gemmatimonadales bacterium]